MKICTASKQSASKRCLLVLFAAGCLLLPVKTIWANGPPRRFRAGAATADITPAFGVSLNGTIMKPGPVKVVHDRIHARAIVLDDGRTRLAIVVCDLCMIEREICDRAKVRIQQKIGLPTNRVLISATHTHAAPRVRHGRVGPMDDQYYTFLAGQIAAAVQQAVKNLAPAEIGWSSFNKPKLVHCRRSLCKPGSVAPNVFGETGARVRSVAGRSSAIIGPAGPVDPQFSLLSVRHTDGAPLAVLGNFSIHYCGGYRNRTVSADYFGYFSTRIEEVLDTEKGKGHPPVVGIMSNGTSGDTGSFSRNSHGKKHYAPFEQMQLVGKQLADEALAVVKKIKYRSDIRLAMKETELQLGVRRPDAKRLAWAKKILADPGKKRLAHPWTRIYARETLALAKYSATRSIKLQAIRIGNLGIAVIPCETFAETGLAIKKNSPFSTTFSMELANGAEGYLPTPKQHRWGGYETWADRTSLLEVQAEPKIRKTLLRLLQEVKDSP